MLKALCWKAMSRWLMVTEWCDLFVLRVHPARSGRDFVGWAKERQRRAHHPSASMCLDGGHASLCSPYAPRQIISDFPKSCQAQESKIFRFRSHANQSHNSACLTADEGRSRTSRTRGEMRWTLRARQTWAPDAYGEVVWFGRRGAGAKSAGSVPLATEAKEPFSGESTL